MNPITEAITAELSERRERKATLDREAETLDLQIGHLEALLTLAEEGPVIPVEDPQDEPADPYEDPNEPDPDSVATEDGDLLPDPEPEPEEPEAKDDTATEVAKSVVKNPPKGGTKAQILEILKGGPRSQADLQREIGISSPTMSTSARDLEAKGEIERNGKDGRSTVWQLPNDPTVAPTSKPATPLLTDAEIDQIEKAEGETEPDPDLERRVGRPHTTPVQPVEADTHTARNGEDIDDVVYEEIQDEGPIEYHEIVTATGESGVLIKAALGRLKAQNRIDEGEDGKYRIRLNQNLPPDEPPAPPSNLRTRIRIVLKAHNGASERKLSGLIKGVADSEIAAELKRMESEDLVNYSGLMRQWKLIED